MDSLKDRGNGIVRSIIHFFVIGIYSAFLGFLVLAERREPLKITNTLDISVPLAATAVVMPVYNEDTQTVFGNIRAVYDSLQERGELAPYDFFILSDSTDPARAVEEGMAWADLCRRLKFLAAAHVPKNRSEVEDENDDEDEND